MSKSRPRWNLALMGTLAIVAFAQSGHAHADVAVLDSSSGAPTSIAVPDPTAGPAMHDLDGKIPMRMVSERVTIDVYPSIVLVEAVFDMQADADIEAFTAAFPELLGLPQQVGAAMLMLDVEIDGESVGLSRGGRLLPYCGRHSEVRWSPETWWAWVMPATSARQHREIRVRYGQTYDLESSSPFTYVLRSGASWLGPIGHGEVELRLHGIPDERLWLQWPDGTGERASSLRWSFDELEPTEDVHFGIRTDRDGPADLDVDLPADPYFELMVRLAMLGLHDEDAAVDQWRRILELMDELEERGGAEAAEVGRLRRAIATALVHSLPPELEADVQALAEKVGVHDLDISQVPPRQRRAQCPTPHPPCGYDWSPAETEPILVDQACLPDPAQEVLDLLDPRHPSEGQRSPLASLVELHRIDRERRRLAAGLGLGAVALVGAGLWWRRRRRDPPARASIA